MRSAAKPDRQNHRDRKKIYDSGRPVFLSVWRKTRRGRATSGGLGSSTDDRSVRNTNTTTGRDVQPPRAIWPTSRYFNRNLYTWTFNNYRFARKRDSIARALTSRVASSALARYKKDKGVLCRYFARLRHLGRPSARRGNILCTFHVWETLLRLASTFFHVDIDLIRNSVANEKIPPVRGICRVEELNFRERRDVAGDSRYANIDRAYTFR